VPLIYGAGSQFKLLEAMACGTPVVATTRAVSALEVRVGEDLLVADHAERFATEILRVINDSEIMHRLSRAGKKYVEDHHSWVSIAAQLEGIYHETIGARDKYIRK
jgi:glycosyltransferase involved in cell wall biosynthesis